MKKTRKRKQQQIQLERETGKKSANATKQEPYPTHHRPTPQECRAIRDSLLSLHGFPQELAKYRKHRPNNSLLSQNSDDNFGGVESEPLNEETVLDGLVKTVLSQNTTEANSLRAFANLKSEFPTWQDVLATELKCIENAIRCGGLAPTKASCIKNMLSCLMEKRGELCLEYLRDLSVDEIKDELSHFKGIGPKTIACVLMFHLQLDDFPVDTHVFEIAKAIGWVPCVADRNKTYLHLNQRIPNELKFDLNCLLYTHGKLCRKCTKKGANQQRKESHDDSCPLLNYSNGYCEKRLKESQEGNGSGKSLGKISSDKIAKEGSSVGELEHKQYECQFCLKEFRNSHPLGGHRNAHKKERQKTRIIQLEERIKTSTLMHSTSTKLFAQALEMVNKTPVTFL